MDARPDKPAEESSPASASPPLPQSSANGPATADTPTTDDGSISPDIESQQIRDYLKVNLLRDDPVETGDVGDAHERIADSITELIRTEKRGAAIALEGPYGSGKSTIVKMIEKRLRAENEREPKQREYHVFTFDAWHHENEALRLAFLHGLLESLQNCGWIPKEQANSLRIDLGKLDGSISETTTTRKLFSSWRQGVGVLCITVALVLWAAHEVVAPMVNWLGQLVSNGFRLLVSYWLGLPVVNGDFEDGKLLLGVGGVALLLGGVGLLSYEAFMRLNEQLQRQQTTDRPKAAHDKLKKHDWLRLFIESFFTGINTTGEQTVVKGEGEVSSRDFESHFRRLLDAAMTTSAETTNRSDRTTVKGTERFVIVVIDNLDRLNQDHAAAVWSGLRVFTEVHSPSIDRRLAISLGRTWLIAPVDREKALKDRSSAQFDKIFQVRYTIPSPRLVNWRAYFITLLGKALPAWTLHYTEAADVIDMYYQHLKRPPTPRELIMIANDMGALIKTCGKELSEPKNVAYFRLRTFAAFVAMRRDGETTTQLREKLGQHQPVNWLKITPFDRDEVLIGIECLTMGTMKPHEAQERRLDRDFGIALSDANMLLLQSLVEQPCFWEWLGTRTNSLYSDTSSFDAWRSVDVLLNRLKLQERDQGVHWITLSKIVLHLLSAPRRQPSEYMYKAATAAIDLCDRLLEAPLVVRSTFKAIDEYTHSHIEEVIEIIDYAESNRVSFSNTPISISATPKTYAEFAYRLFSATDRHRQVLKCLTPTPASVADSRLLLANALDQPDPALAIRALLHSGGWDYVSLGDARVLVESLLPPSHDQRKDSIEYRLTVSKKATALQLISDIKDVAIDRQNAMYNDNQGNSLHALLINNRNDSKAHLLYLEAFVYHSGRHKVTPGQYGVQSAHQAMYRWPSMLFLHDRQWQDRLFSLTHPMLLDGRFTEALLNAVYGHVSAEPLQRWIKMDAAIQYRNRMLNAEMYKRCKPYLHQYQMDPILKPWIDALTQAHTPALPPPPGPSSASSSATIASASPATPPTPPPQPTEPPQTGP